MVLNIRHALGQSSRHVQNIQKPFYNVLIIHVLGKSNPFLSFLIISFHLAWAYFAFLEILFNRHVDFILNLDTSTFMYTVGSLEVALKGLI